MPKSPLLPIFLIVSVDVLGLTIILPLLPFYAEKFGASPAVVGLLVSTYALCQLIAGPILGRWSDHMGRRPLLLVSQLGTFIGFLILAYANALWLIFLSRIIDGLTAGNLSLAQAYISDVTKPRGSRQIVRADRHRIRNGIFDRARRFRVFSSSTATSIRSSPQPRCRQPASSRPIFCCLPARPRRRMALTPRKFTVLDWGNYLRYFREPGLAPLLWQFLAFALAFSMFMSGFPLFAERRFDWHGHAFGPKEVGYVYAYLGLLGVILQGGLIGRLVKMFGEPNLVRAGFFCAMAGLAALGFTYGVPLLLVVTAVASSGMGAIRPALTSLITQKAARSRARRGAGIDAVAEFDCRHRGAGDWRVVDRSFAAGALGVAGGGYQRSSVVSSRPRMNADKRG